MILDWGGNRTIEPKTNAITAKPVQNMLAKSLVCAKVGQKSPYFCREIAVPNRTTISRFSDKLKLLLRVYNMEEEVFLTEIANKMDFGGIDRRTAANLLGGSFVPNTRTRETVRSFLSTKLGVRDDTLRNIFSHQSLAEFEQNLLPRESVRFGSYVGIIGPIESIDKKTAAVFCGKYNLYRPSFTDQNTIVVELATIEEINADNVQLLAKIYSPRPHYIKYGGRAIEIYSGVIFGTGVSYYSILNSIENSDFSEGLRIIQFPSVDDVRLEWVSGLMMGYSRSLRRPVSTIVAAQKIDTNSKVEDRDLHRIARMRSDHERVRPAHRFLETTNSNRSVLVANSLRGRSSIE